MTRCYTDMSRDPPFSAAGWPVRADAWVMWGTLELPRMHWGAERRCRFVQDRSIVVGWDGAVAPCYALSHDYTYHAIDGRQKQVTQYALGNVNQQSLAEVWMSEDYVRFRSEVRAFSFPSCPDCDLRDTCDLRERNEGCWGWNPSCADCLWGARYRQVSLKCQRPFYVKVFATLLRYLPGWTSGQVTEISLPAGATVRALVDELRLPREDVKVVFVNGRARSMGLGTGRRR